MLELADICVSGLLFRANQRKGNLVSRESVARSVANLLYEVRAIQSAPTFDAEIISLSRLSTLPPIKRSVAGLNVLCESFADVQVLYHLHFILAKGSLCAVPHPPSGVADSPMCMKVLYVDKKLP